MLLEKWSKKDSARKGATESPAGNVAAMVRIGPNDLVTIQPAHFPTPEEASDIMRTLKRIATRNKRRGVKESGSQVLRKLRDGRLK
jgi:hypothetical protein